MLWCKRIDSGNIPLLFVRIRIREEVDGIIDETSGAVVAVFNDIKKNVVCKAVHSAVVRVVSAIAVDDNSLKIVVPS